MTNKDFKEGMEVTCELFGIKTNDLVLRYKDNKWYVVSEKLLGPVVYNGVDGKFYRWIPVEEATNLQPKHRTIDDLECGDYVVDESGWKRKCLGVCGEVYAMSSNWKKTVDNSDKIDGGWWTIYQLKKCGYTLYQPEEVKEKTTRERILELMRDSDQEWACDEIIKLKETDIDEVTLDRCIKVVGDYFEHGNSVVRNELVQALKELRQERNKLAD